MAIHNDNTHQQLRLATQIARLYHEQNRTQPEIAQLLSITQTRVSRMLKFASENGIIRTTVHVPPALNQISTNMASLSLLLEMNSYPRSGEPSTSIGA